MIRTGFATSTQKLARLREKYKAARGRESCEIAARILTYTDAEIRAAFGLSATQLTNFKSRANTKINKLAAVDAEAGE